MKRSRWILKRGKLKAHILEEDVLKEIVTRLWYEYRIKVWRVRERIPGVGALSTAGIPDLIGWLPQTIDVWMPNGKIKWALPLFIECKRPGGARRPAQIQFIDAAKRDGCIAFFAECWVDVVRELDAVGIKLKEAA